MRSFGEFILRNRWNALATALILATLPFLGWVATVILGLVTLRKGWRAGSEILIVVCLPSTIFFFFSHLDLLFLINTLLTNLYVCLLACILRYSISWTWVIQVTMLLGILTVLSIHGLYPDANKWLEQRIIDYMQQAKPLLTEWNTDKITDFSKRVADIAIGAQVAMVLLGSLSWLAISRWWQATLFNPGQLQPELHQIRLGKSISILGLMILAVALLTHAIILTDLIPVVTLPFIMSSISLVHYFSLAKKLSIFWLGTFYLIIILLFHNIIWFLIILGSLDSILNIRTKIQTKQT